MISLREIAKKSTLSQDQLKKIEGIILKEGNYAQSTIRKAIDWFCSELGMDEYYFKTTPLKTIAHHIEAVKSAVIIASLKKEKDLTIELATEHEDEAIYLVDDFHYRALEIERRIEKKYPHSRLQTYRTSGKTLGTKYLRFYQVNKTQFCSETKCPEETDLKKIACRLFLRTATKDTMLRYSDILNRAQGWETPLIDVSRKEETRETRIMVAINR